MTTVTKSIDVDVPCRTAYDQWTQFESFPQFMHDVESVTQTDETHNHWKTRIGGVEREFDTEIIEQRPDSVIAWKSTTGPMHAGYVEFQALDPVRTRVTARLEWIPEGVTEKAGEVLGFDDRAVEGDMKRFKKFIENRGAPSGAWRGEVNDSDPVANAAAKMTTDTTPDVGTLGMNPGTTPTSGTTYSDGEPL